MSEVTMTTAQALNAFWDELDPSIPEDAQIALLAVAAHAATADGICVKEPANV